VRRLDSFSEDLKPILSSVEGSKTCPESFDAAQDRLRRSIEKTKWAWVVAIVVVFVTCAAVAQTQQLKKVPRLGFLVPGNQAAFATRIDAFRQGLREFGYSEGQNIIVEYRYAERGLDQLPELADELVRLKVDIIVTAGTGTRAAKNATSTIPVVFAAATDPVATGLIDSLARPGGNITGVTNLSEDLDGKRLELLKESVSKLSRLAHLWNPESQKSDVQSTAQEIGLKLHTLEVRSSKEFDGAFQTILKERAEALIISPSPLFITFETRIVNFAAKNRLPSINQSSSYVEAGGLMSYGLVFGFNFRRAAYFVDKILKGAKPADLPVEQPTKFEFVINLKTAKQIGLTIPPNVLARADRVIR
jgi:putative ABC transport system substrate-binding protein